MIGQAARLAGVNIETIRYYQRRGLIERPDKSAGQAYRRYNTETIARIRFIRKTQALGFSLREIQDLLALSAQDSADCGDVRNQAVAKIKQINAKISELARISDRLERVVAACPGSGHTIDDCTILQAPGSEQSGGTGVHHPCDGKTRS
uniref:MerR family transcriptional regulator n=1 Tax=Pararhizobium sp. IMCC3301 TaxID=3067904 RepID=UPI0027419280|nr:MerR family DNA-binding protein [Pararhizobium sp. IMCC3301]